MRVDYTRGERPSARWTTRQLRKYIRDVTKVTNAEYSEWEETEYTDYGEKYLSRFISRLQELAGTKPKKQKVGLGLTYKHKTELVEQAQALWNYQEQDHVTPGGRIRERKRNIARYMDYMGYEPPKDIEVIDVDEFDKWQARYEGYLEREQSYDYYEPASEEYSYNPSEEEWHESEEERADRERREAGVAAYDLAKEKDKKKFDTFIKNHKDIDITFDEWEMMVTYAGGVGSFIGQELNSETYVEQTRKRTREGRMTLDIVYQEAESQLKAEVNAGKINAVTPKELVKRMADISKNWGQYLEEYNEE